MIDEAILQTDTDSKLRMFQMNYWCSHGIKQSLFLLPLYY